MFGCFKIIYKSSGFIINGNPGLVLELGSNGPGLTCIDDMHIDMLGVAGAGVALVLPGVLLRTVAHVDIIINIK